METNIIKKLVFLSSLSSLITLPLQAGEQCHKILSNEKVEAVSTESQVYKENFKVDNQPVRDKAKYFKDIRWLLKSSLPEIRRELSKINNELGSEIELKQTMAFLRDVPEYEFANLNNIQTINNAVIYGSTNVPLYTLVTQAFLVGSFSKNVWFRTPEASRDIYLKIFNVLKSYLPKEYTDNIHLVTDPSDLSYDVFNRIFVMGLNRSGNKVLRPPSELVILTGNPETARTMIDRNIRNLQKISGENKGRKQLFLGFLAGVNPAIVVPSARENMKSVLDNLTYPFLVNGGQDCMNSDVVFAHKDIAMDLQKGLMARFQMVKMTTNADIERGITPLTMAKNFDKLTSYRSKYEKYLVNKDATIDFSSRKVTPHLFVIPFSEFKNLDIQEHFAPFMTVVKFDSMKELEQASLDPRIQKKSMYALVFGGNKMSSDLETARDIFRQSQHGVFTNSHLYEEYEMNMPFGGVGTDSSMSVLAKMEESGEVTVLNRNRPLLISKEMESVFPKNFQPPPLKMAKSVLPKSYWGEMTHNEVTNLEMIQRVASQKGLYYVIDKPPTTPLEQTKQAQLYGIPSVDRKTQKKISGVVLHTTNVGQIQTNPNVKGDINLLIGQPELLKRFDSKTEEIRLVRSIDPKAMPGMYTFTERHQGEWLKSFEQERKTLIADLVVISQRAYGQDSKDGRFEENLELRLYNFVQKYLAEVRRQFPQGAYIKNYGEFASGDLGNAVTSFNSSPNQIVKEFVLWYGEARVQNRYSVFTDQQFQKFVKRGVYANSTRFLNTLLIDPQSLLIQERLELTQTHLGAPMEFRVDFIQGNAISSRMRFGFEHYPREMQKAMKIISDFMAKAPEQIRSLSGGADVALTRDGRWVIFEFNFGGASGTLAPEFYPFEANAIFSRLQNKDTWLMNYAKQLAGSSNETQRNFLLSLKNEKPVWWKTSIDEISRVEWAKWLRDQKLNQWMRTSNKKETVEQLHRNLKELLEDLGSPGNLDFQRLYESAEHFIRRELSQ